MRASRTSRTGPWVATVILAVVPPPARAANDATFVSQVVPATVLRGAPLPEAGRG